MITAVDTSALLANAKGEPSAQGWAAALEKARARGPLVICDVVAAELYAYWEDEAALALSVASASSFWQSMRARRSRRAGALRFTGRAVVLVSMWFPLFLLQHTRCGRAISWR